jgi:hypothetical protein
MVADLQRKEEYNNLKVDGAVEGLNCLDSKPRINNRQEQWQDIQALK